MSLFAFPVYLAANGFVPPESGTYYLVAKDGIYLRTERLHGSSLVKVKSIPFLDEANLNTKFTLPNIPAKIVHQAKTFFRAVFDNHQSESYLTLFYSKKLNDYNLWCPKQTVSYGSVNYDRTDTVPVDERDYFGSEGSGWQMVGTIHSHCDFSAFHSGTDEADEASFDGIHLTFGHVNSDKFSIASSICFNDNRTKMNPLDVADGLISDSEEEITEIEEYNHRGSVYKKSNKRIEYWFRLDELKEDEKAQHAEFLANVLPLWMEKVTKHSINSNNKDLLISSWTYKDIKNNSDEESSDEESSDEESSDEESSDGESSDEEWYDMWRVNQKYKGRGRDSIYRSEEDRYGIREWDGD
jgi:hypothetical protein